MGHRGLTPVSQNKNLMMHLDAVQTRGYYLNIAAMRQLFYYWENPLPHRHAFSLETRRQNLLLVMDSDFCFAKTRRLNPLLVIGLGFLLRKNKEDWLDGKEEYRLDKSRFWLYQD